MRVGSIVACLSLFVACGGSDHSPPPLPQITTFGGPIMAHPQLVPIFFPGDPDISTLTSFSQWIVTSNWFGEVGAEYGIGAGSVLGTVQLPMPAPSSITDAEIVDMMFQGVTSGSWPKPADGNFGDVLYVVHVPAQTTETSGTATSCVDYGGYHSSARRNGVELSYAVIATCSGAKLNSIQLRELFMSHELIEAATDPLPGNHPAYRLNDLTSPWSSTDGEVGDLCELSGQEVWQEDGYVVQRSWSNLAAEASGDPCVPVPSNTVYFNLQVGGRVPPRIPAGGHQTLNLTGWATGKVADWSLETKARKPGEVTLTLGATTLNAGRSTTLDVAFPATARTGAVEQFYLFSSLADGTYETLPMYAIVGAPCASFTGCQACTAQPGCGFCATSGRCENIGASGSADSACPAASFAEGLGDCPGYCASHNGSCTDCASQPGCGWCDAGAASQCVGIDRETLLPANNACSYASWDLTPSYCPM